MNEPSLGAKLRHLRKARRLTLTELAAATHLSPSFLSQVERNQANPSVTTLHSIAAALGLPLGALFNDAKHSNGGTPPEPASRVAVVRADRRKTLIYPGSSIRNELLSPDLKRAIQFMWIVMPPGTETGDRPLQHQGEECALVMQGVVEVWIGEEHHILEAGDAIYHPSTLPHRSRNIGDTDVIVVAAITPPSF